MLTGIDHIIIGVSDLEKAAEQFGQKLGLLASGGGIHPTSGTANRIIVIGTTYLELIAVRAPGEAQQSMLDRLAKGEGYLNMVLASNDIEADGVAMRGRGVTIFGPKAGELCSADGHSRKWSRIDVERPDLAQRYPFLIQHDSIGEERRFRLAGWTTPPEHPLGVTRVISATIAVASLEDASQRFSRIYGIQPSEPYTGDADGWDAMLVSLTMKESGQHLELAMPLSLSAEEDREIDMEHLPEAGALARYIQRWGERVCRVTLAVRSLDAARQYLEAQGVTYTHKKTLSYLSLSGYGSDERNITYESKDEVRPAIWIHPDYACGAAIVLHEQG